MNKPSSKRKKSTISSSTDSTPPDNLTQEEDPASATITVTAVEVPELTEQEQRDSRRLKLRLSPAFRTQGRTHVF